MASMNLATELWIDILKRIVDVPGWRTLHTDLPYEPPSCVEYSQREKLDVFIDASIKHKVTLSYVCKLWASILEEPLFEIIMISNVKQLRLLADTLTRNPLRGTFVRRIDLRVRDPEASRTVYSETMETILKHCVNLEIFIDRESPYAPVQYQAFALLSRHASRLRYFSFLASGPTPLVEFSKYAPLFARLEVLSMRALGWAEYGSPDSMLSLCFPNLHSLTFGLIERKALTPLATWNLPALTNVEVCYGGLDPMPFFEAHGHLIKVLILPQVFPSLQRIIDICSSNFVTLIHPFEDTSAFRSAIKHMPELCLLGVLPSYNRYYIADHFEDLFDAYFGSNHTLPKLRELRFVRCESDFELEMWRNKRIRLWKKQQARWIQSGVNLAVPGGHLFPGPKH